LHHSLGADSGRLPVGGLDVSGGRRRVSPHRGPKALAVSRLVILVILVAIPV